MNMPCRNGSLFAIVSLIALVATATAWATPPSVPSSPSAANENSSNAKNEKETGKKNLLIITIDTLRADYLGPREDGQTTSPAIDAFGRTATVFENAYSHTSWTLPAMATLLTSLHTSAHQCWRERQKLSASFVTLPEYLGEHGYTSAAFSTTHWFGKSYGLDQGFDEFDLVTGRPKKGQRRSELVMQGITSPEVTARGTQWLKNHRSSQAPWLLWLHYLDPHDAYLPHEENPERFQKNEAKTLYEGEIHYTDQWIGRLLDSLDSLGLAESTVVVMTSDHGEEFLDHGRTGHGLTLYDEQLHVPLMIRAPGLAPRQVTNAVGTIDMLPTVLELLELPPAENIEGRSLAAAMRGEALQDKYILFEMRGVRPEYKIRGVRDTRYKLLVSETGESQHLFDTDVDPAEKQNQVSELGKIADAMNQTLKSLVQASTSLHSGESSPETAEPTKEEVESLKALGYIMDPE